MEDLIDILESFNRKERYLLLTQTLALRSEGEQAAFRLDGEFRKKLGYAMGLEEQGIKICKDAFVAMDYHLDWIHASLTLADRNDIENVGTKQKKIFPYHRGEVAGTPEDIDLLVAFKANQYSEYHLILIEAKGYSAWNKNQLRSKAKRLGRIFGDDGNRCRGVQPHFALMSESPIPMAKWAPLDWPKWMRSDLDRCPISLDLNLFHRSKIRVEGCIKSGKKSKNGKHFHCPSA